MLGLLWLIPFLPFAGFLVLALVGPRLSRRGVAAVGVGSVGLSALLALLIAADFLNSPPPGYAFTQTLWTWMRVDNLTPEIALYLDALSLVFVLVVTFVGFLIHLYSAEFMAEEEGYNRFFAYMNLFVGSMLTLVLAGNLLLLFLGWEGVGLCSYLLIGFWYRDPANGWAARKAFIVTRVGDTAFLLGLFLLFNNLGTLQIQELLGRAARDWPEGSLLAVAAAALLLGGAVGKSAQLPLQTWLPDAMAGPTPVSALIHAATMVTAGVYLIARTHVLFSLAPAVMLAVAVIGAVTLLLAGFSALTQWDIKRVLAYSTISQIGLMFLALGVGAWSAAVFHFMTHAFFKALMFLAAGVVILALHHETNMFRMGGLRRELPLAFWTFLIGSASLAGVPLVTAGFYSKESILSGILASGAGGLWLGGAAMLGALLTAIYSFRMVFLTFFGEVRQRPTRGPDPRMQIPLVTLAVLSVVGGFLDLPRTLGGLTLLSDFLHTALPAAAEEAEIGVEAMTGITASIVALGGIYLAYLLFLRSRQVVEGWVRTAWGSALHRLWLTGWGFDWLYDRLFVWPVMWMARVNRDDFVDLFYRGIAWLSRLLYRLLSKTETGEVLRYAMGIALGAAVLIAIGVFL